MTITETDPSWDSAVAELYSKWIEGIPPSERRLWRDLIGATIRHTLPGVSKGEVALTLAEIEGAGLVRIITTSKGTLKLAITEAGASYLEALEAKAMNGHEIRSTIEHQEEIKADG